MAESSTESRFDDILSLVIAHSRGEVSNDVVENALASIIPPVENQNEDRSPAGAVESPNHPSNTNDIVLDTDDYDFDDEDDGQQEMAASMNVNHQVLPQKRGRGRPRIMNPIADKIKAYEDSLEDIPMGKMGSKMLITFGDGPQPLPQVVRAALLGARSSLQRAVLDARALHRRQRDQWHHARASAADRMSAARENLKKTTGAVAAADLIVDNEMSFRALNPDWAREIPCGFDTESLEILFPEEMNAYQRWKKMHDAYSSNSSDETKLPKLADPEEDTTNDESNNETHGNDIESSGRLHERLGNFDARTDNMNSDKYIKFADVRKGSFLPRKELSTEKREWAKSNSTRQKGRVTKNRTTWTNLHPASVVFLHWLGFEPMSALPPPDEETTQALGYLAHDFLGKIVEKAVVLRLEQSKTITKHGFLPELTGGDQLSVKDIQRAISETSLKSLYSSSNGDIGKSTQIAQLYFGLGFEDRLELELEEIFGAKDKRLTAEELKMRQDEEALFSGLTDPPPMLGAVANASTQENEDDGATVSKKLRTDDEK